MDSTSNPRNPPPGTVCVGVLAEARGNGEGTVRVAFDAEFSEGVGADLVDLLTVGAFGSTFGAGSSSDSLSGFSSPGVGNPSGSRMLGNSKGTGFDSVTGGFDGGGSSLAFDSCCF